MPFVYSMEFQQTIKTKLQLNKVQKQFLLYLYLLQDKKNVQVKAFSIFERFQIPSQIVISHKAILT